MSASEAVTFGKYTLLERIGSGGMAEIWKASLESIDGFQKILVVKKILPKYAHNRQFITMFIQEAKVCSGLHHANVVQIYELGEFGGDYYMAMEYVPGWDLLNVLTRASKAKMPIPEDLAAYMVQEVCKGLGYAHTASDMNGHALDIIHLDCSPSNILLSGDGEVKLTDFGVARASVEGAPSGRDDRLKGKLGYMSPEQVTGKVLDSRSDLFSMGIILYELFTLKRLFLGRNDLETLSNIRDANIEPRLKRHPEIPEGIQAIIRKTLSANVDTRYQTALEIEDALSQWLFEQRIRVTGQKLGAYLKELFAQPLPEKKKTKEQLRAARPSGDDTAAHGKAREADDDELSLGMLVDQPVSEAGVPETRVEEGRHKDRGRTTPDSVATEWDRAPSGNSEVTPIPSRKPLSAPGLLEQQSYQFRTSTDSAVFGPVTYNNLSDLMRSHAVSPDEMVSIDGRTWRTVREVTDFDRLMPSALQRERREPDDVGVFGPSNAARLMARMASGKRTGRFKLVSAGVLKEVYFRKGKPVHVSSNIKSELFGAHLVKAGIVSDAQLADAIAAIKTSKFQPLGTTLVQLGHLQQSELFMQLDLQFQQKFKQIFSWTGGSYEYYRSMKPPPDAVPFLLNPLPAIADGIRRFVAPEFIEEHFANLGHKAIRLVADQPFDPAELKFQPREHRVKAILAARPTTLPALIEQLAKSTEDRRTILFVLFVLHQTEQIRIR